MSKIKNNGLDRYGAEPFEQRQFRTVGIQGVNACSLGVDGDAVARGPDAATLLDNTDTRNKIVDELMEVPQLLMFCPYHSRNPLKNRGVNSLYFAIQV